MKKDKNTPVYMIGIAAELVSMHPQTLRLYEREELVVPKRSAKETRLYSELDIELLREIHDMTQTMGLNLAGVKLILKMKEDFKKQKSIFEKLRNEAQNGIEKMQQEMDEKIEEVKKSFRHDVVLYKKPYLVKGGEDV